MLQKSNNFKILLLSSVVIFFISFLIYFLTPNKKEMPNRISFHKIQGGRVLFNHKIHNEDYSVECSTCHHNIENDDEVYNCSECHMKEEGDDILKRSEALHTLCIDCHKESDIEATKCADCHNEY